ncbi:hypothetical protein N7489_011583 [Penicillium chrysogenum]|uniref:uncharacterized protein n=1 Tax=Penicillium chrysogenum TaxID=5076 RepID=UPI0024DF0A5B|nr:uncharacterized protein N7489_011583 [Penicillium chrysogenum]KAJ5230875.1 hypothetical protein N7489_011583 [Penicillium chrysogenum]
MHAKVVLAGAALTAVSMIPSCPAPIVGGLIAGAFGAELAGNLIYIGLNDNLKRSPVDSSVKARSAIGYKSRRALGYPGVSDESVQQCKDSNSGKTDVKVTQTEAHSYRIDNVTPECMNLAALFTEDSPPVPCGSACLQYSNLSESDNNALQGYIQELL